MAEESLKFNIEFQRNGSHPTYCFISKEKVTATRLTKKQVLNLKNRKLEEAIFRNENCIKFNKLRFYEELSPIKDTKLKKDIINFTKCE